MWVFSTVSMAAGRLVSYRGRWKSWKEWSYAFGIFAQNQNFPNLQYLGVFTNVLNPQQRNLEDCTLFSTFTILCLLKNWLGLTALNQHKLFSISEVNIFRRGLLAFANLLVEPDQYLVATDLCMQCLTPISAPGIVGWCVTRGNAASYHFSCIGRNRICLCCDSAFSATSIPRDEYLSIQAQTLARAHFPYQKGWEAWTVSMNLGS